MIINCPDCGKQISDKANYCINCGCPTSIDQKEQEQTTEEKNNYQQPKGESDTPEVTTLKSVGTVVLVIGIICSVVMLFAGIAQTNWLGVWMVEAPYWPSFQ